MVLESGGVEAYRVLGTISSDDPHLGVACVVMAPRLLYIGYLFLDSSNHEGVCKFRRDMSSYQHGLSSSWFSYLWRVVTMSGCGPSDGMKASSVTNTI